MGSATEIPTREKDEEAPDWNLTELDRMLLRQADEEYEPHSWDELKWIIRKYGHPFPGHDTKSQRREK
jgi:hypothetical protein